MYSVNPLYLIFNRVNGSKYLTLVPNNESKEEKKYEELWSKTKDLIRLITKKSDDYNELPLNQTIEIPTMAIVVRAVFHENNKYHPQVFLDEFLYKLYLSDKI